MSAASIQPSAGLMAAADAAAADQSAEAAGEPTQHASLKAAAATSPNIPLNFDTEAEQTLLELQIRPERKPVRRGWLSMPA